MITFFIVVLNMLLSIAAFKNQGLMNRMIFNPYLIRQNNEWHRLITSGFVHADWMHLLINMFVLYGAGSIIENYYSQMFGSSATIYFLLLYVGGLIVSVLPTYFKKNKNPNYNALGASGAVSGVLFTYILFQPFSSICLYFVLCLPGVVMGIGYLVYSYFASKKQSDHINHDAHFWGALFGVAFNLALTPSLGSSFIQQLNSYFNL